MRREESRKKEGRSSCSLASLIIECNSDYYYKYVQCLLQVVRHYGDLRRYSTSSSSILNKTNTHKLGLADFPVHV
jgi:hypothetical protein